MSDVVLKVENVYKKFSKSIKDLMRHGAADIIKDFFGMHFKQDKLRKGEFWAVQDVSFELKKGETLGIIGVNGSGKTTLLRMLNGIFMPDTGKITIHGRIGALIAVGAGFHPLLSGRDNVYINGQILGMSKKEIDEKFQDIIDFADIGDFLDSPVKHYSSGMLVRLGFAIAVHSSPEILLVDEILAVGDMGFMLKCFNKIGELRKNGVTTIIVSHDMQNIAIFADKILLIHNGVPEFFGDVIAGIKLFKKHFSNMFASSGQIEKVISGTNEFIIDKVEFEPLMNADNIIIMNNCGDLKYSVYYDAKTNFDNIKIDTTMYIPLPGNTFFQASNLSFNKRLDIKKGKGEIIVRLKNITLNNITATLNFAIWKENQQEILFWWRQIPVQVVGNAMASGWSNFNMDFEIIKR